MATLDPAGYTARDLNNVMQDLRSAAITAFGPNINLSADGHIGILLGVFAEAIADVEKATQSIYDAFNLNNAEGEQLDNLAGIIGIQRLSATRSRALVDLTGVAGTVVPPGSLVRNVSAEDFITTSEATIPATGVEVVALDTGPVDVVSGTIDTILTPVGGWSGVNNPNDGTEGRLLETDPELRARVSSAPSAIGSCTVEAIKDDLQQALPDAQTVMVLENTNNFTSATGLPPHSFRAILWPNTLDPQTIGETLWSSKPAGIATSGTQLYNVTDSMGFLQPMMWSWATEFNVEVDVQLMTNADYPGDAAVRDAVEAYIEGLGVGESIRAFKAECAVTNAVAGIDNITITYRQKGTGSYVGTPLYPGFDGKPLIEDAATDIAVTT